MLQPPNAALNRIYPISLALCFGICNRYNCTAFFGLVYNSALQLLSASIDGLVLNLRCVILGLKENRSTSIRIRGVIASGDLRVLGQSGQILEVRDRFTVIQSSHELRIGVLIEDMICADAIPYCGNVRLASDGR